MNINSEILQQMKKNNNVITTSQVMQLGYSKALLTKYVKAGLLERSRHGVYSLPDAVNDDMYALMLRSSKIIFSHDTALFLNGLSERTPFRHTVTIPSDSALPASIKGECNCFYIKPELHRLGMIEKKTTFGNNVRCYNMERTICDFLRSRNRCDEETLISAVKNYAVSKDKNLSVLSEYAKRLRVEKSLKHYLEVLL
ncbi:MAG TPA: AbiEi antitoxin N-terminal domain-containing protein [Spirochaetales bacterium]|jgi:predicted transcriptional regulator of viral defense system|nr:AbiEi antitoxin N-terminal domain-containing protein [Spirochaetales bacterium]